MPWTEGFLHHIQDSTTMKTLIVLCSLATIAIAVPTPLRENFDNIASSHENIPEVKIREKKSPLNDPSEDRSLDDARENTQIRHSHKTEVLRPSSGNTRVGLRKPIIIKKKFRYHVYRDSDEEMAHADPNEKCRKQFKVKLCDDELLLHSNNEKNFLSEHEIISDKEIGNNVKIAKAAVENLERSLQKKEQNSVRKSNSKEELESDISLHKDIEIAKSALEHIQKNMGNLESIEVQLNDAKMKEVEHLKSINKWKEAIDNIHKNVETPKNFEDAFKFEKQNLHNSENINIPKMSENEHLADLSKNIPQTSLPTAKAIYDDNKDSHEPSSKSKNTKDEQDINEENDMFVSPTDHKESKMKLHSESLTSENMFDTKSSIDHDAKLTNLNTDHVITTKNFEILTQDSDFENMKMANVDMQEPGTKSVESMSENTLQQNNGKNVAEGFDLNTFANNKNINSLSLGAKSIENAENKKITQDSHIESAISNDQCEEEKHDHNPTVKSPEVITDQRNAETKNLGDNKLSTEPEVDLTKQTEQRHTERLSKESMDQLSLIHPKMSLLEEKEVKDEEKHIKLALDNNSLHQKHFESHARANVVNNGGRDFTKELNSHLPEVNEEPLTALGPMEHIPNKFSNMRLTEDHNMDQLYNTNHESPDFHSKHLIQENEHKSSRMEKDSNIENQFNDFHQSFMRLAQEKRLNDILSQQLHTVSEPNDEHKTSQQTKNNEFRNEYVPIELLNARMNQNHNMGQQLHENHDSRDFLSMSIAPNMRPIDHSTQHLKSVTEFYNEHELPANMRLTDDQNVENMGYELTGSQILNNPQLAGRWAQDKQQQDSHAFNTVSEFQNADILIPMTKNNEFHIGQHAHKEQMNMRVADDQNLRHLFTDTRELHEPHLMHWAQEKQNNDDLAQMFDTEGEFYNAPHVNDHIQAHYYPPTSTNRYSNHFDLDNNHEGSPIGSTMPDHFHILKHSKSSDMDSAMQPSVHIPMRDSAIQRGHHHHHQGLARSSYLPIQTNAGSNSGAVGVFSNGNTGCGIPLLVSCSPSVVSGSLTRGQHVGMSAPAYRGADNLMYYMKRDANKIEGNQNVKIQKTPIPPTH